MQQEFRLSGSGGQGLILAGIILAEAALLDGKNVVQSQSYGPEARGGASKSEIIISDKIINYPKIGKCDILLCLTQKAYDKYLDTIKPEGTLIIDSSIIVKQKAGIIRILDLPIIDTAANELNKPMVSNIIALGCICMLTSIVSESSLEKAVLSRVPFGTEQLNKRALYEGFRLIERYRDNIYGKVSRSY